jgi:endonuclease/exonuclease/phosphatase family metal-dependent hydrolase
VPNSKSWGNRYTRICTWVRLVDKAGKGIFIYNTHWDHESQASREKSALLILKMIKQRKNKAEPYILMGDFNATTENAAVKTLLSDGLLIDHGKQQMKTSNLWKAEIRDGLRIDHIFVSPELKKAEVKVVATGDPPASDHHPVVMRVNLGAGSGG